MTYDSDPPRLRLSGSPGDPLVLALEEARLDLPSEEQLAEIASRLLPANGSGSGRDAPISIGRGRLRAKSLQAGAIALVLAMGAAAAVMMRAHLPFVSAPNVAPPPSPPAAAPTAPPEKAMRPRRTDVNAVAPTAEAPPPVEASKPRSAIPAPTAHGAPASTHQTVRPSQADLPSSEVDGPPTAETEAALLDRAHQSLAADPSRALTLTEEHRRDYPSGALGQESDLIAIEALAALGRLGEAGDRAAHFRERYPRSAHLRRIDRLLGEPTGAPPPPTP
jgi:hypothetical protein